MNSYERKVLEEETREKLVSIHREKLLQVKVVAVLEQNCCVQHTKTSDIHLDTFLCITFNINDVTVPIFDGSPL